ncbi:ABC transporter ATP-binding protein [Dactylosporangium sp. CA-092794]|uniref:ABC transporter ATP-binding protein n=1 Tax=Dactylosporangium sp. CA-092794 TaxID=3239929 RepID=UPI003D949A29
MAGADEAGRVPAGDQTALVVEDVHVAFGGVRAVDGVSLSLRRDEILSLLGQNGAGKTTLLNCVSRSVRHTAGRIAVLGHDVAKLAPYQVTRLGVSRTFQSVALFGQLNALQVGLLGVDFRSRATMVEYALRLPRALRDERAAKAKVVEALRFVGFDAPLERRLGELSYGQAKLADLARAVTAGPRLLLLDEPAAGLNGEERRVIAEAIERVHKELSVPVIVIEHDIDLVRRLSHRTVIMDAGRVIGDGRLDDLLARPEVSASLLGTAATAT